MRNPSDADDEWERQRNRIIGLGELSVRKNYYPALRRNLSELKLMLAAVDQTTVGIVVCDPDGVIEFANEAQCRITGYAMEELIGHTPQLYRSQQTPGELFTDMWQKIRAGETWHGELWNRRKTGEEIWTRLSIAPVHADADDITHFVSVLDDVTELKNAEEARRSSDTLLRTVIESIPDLVWLKDLEGIYLGCNPAFAELYGTDEIDIIGKTDFDFVSPKSAAFFREKDLLAIHTNAPITFEEMVTFASNGREALLETSKVPLRDVHGAIIGVLGVARDITDRKKIEMELRASEDRYRSLFENNLAGFAYHEIIFSGGKPVDFVYLANNHRFEVLTGLSDVVGKTGSDVLPHLRVTDADLIDAFFRVAVTGKPERFERFISALEQWFFISIYSNEKNHFAVLLDNITDRKNAERRVEFLAFHDPLTELPNRLLTQDRLSQAMALAERSGAMVAILYLDVDNFKFINDSLGHSVGDDLLRKMASRVVGCVRDTDTVGRQSGDEFLVILPEIRDAEAISTACEKILLCLVDPIDVDGQVIPTSISIGISVFPNDGADYATLIRKADRALYSAKEAGRNTYRFFDPKMNFDQVENLRLRTGLRQALENSEFVLHYQPQINLSTGATTGVEALIRWNSPDMGLVAPGRFISVAEDSGLIVPIGEWVLREACRQAAIWQKAWGYGLTMAVNLSALQFRRGSLEQVVKSALDDSGLAPQLLELEITESVLIGDTEAVFSSIRSLKELGVRLSIDDFGTGYSSLSYLKKLKVDKLKIDQSFVRDISRDPENAAIVLAIIQMAKSLNLRCIAEGVETEKTLNHLISVDCQEVQGFYFARPMPADELAVFLETRRASNEAPR
ncbi:EAL domain-containing protein [Telmatospirillum sp.]|uniref:sensor domain-containing protein n=1 Tax=Telmatospirillum sp. TaxID=2079197 RepID=UPI00283F1D4C|nr:EAL domain-containing protein [Telmatospirillum sp.]MDR3435151.1 EAL domain-containing protein [Telmatospirillum sp.]